MISIIESVTVGVSQLEPGIHLFREQLGLSVVNDTRASVGLLSAWKVPVHESVRLVELANGTNSLGRVRLACYEDDTPNRVGQESGAKASHPSTAIGLKAIDFRKPALAGAAVASAEDLPVWLPSGSSTSAPQHTSEIAAVWLVTADPAASTLFYCETFGFTAAAAPDLEDQDRKALCRLLGAQPDARIQFTALRPSGGESTTQIVLVHFPDITIEPPAHPMRPGQLGFNLISFHCDDFDTLIERFEELGVEPLTPPTHVGLPVGRPGRVMLVRGPNQELFEFTEIAA